MTPAFGHGHLRLYLLSLLAESPRHGYELIQALGDRFGGTYIPSAGTIYPRLAKLEEDGLITGSADGRKTVYAITDAGRAELAARESELGGIEDEVTDTVRRLADEVRESVGSAMKSLRADLASAAREASAEAKRAGTSTKADLSGVRTEVRALLQDADVALSTFRADLRAELRSADARGALSARTVDALREGLETVRRSVAESLREHPHDPAK
ncbi:PadR family transcriptional regulator [Galbitalea soli]|uniref:Helix-turn-helix transcriptional regulator n=1 Tax=Galbitalea soli TaxID=1268042 RepID=A0A7C9PP46_9MICO|nr:PadR family transcriptional regulator [Galbitalea soli]NEM91926.1 helix-turn-helix transcriptional regulator [Galbitalea soli]NYJ29237.1 DNA-binding PadR family transcriptional regulator [Galbitalea soli]